MIVAIILALISVGVCAFLAWQFATHKMGGCACHPDTKPYDVRRLW